MASVGLGRPLSHKTAETAGPVETADWYYYDFATDSALHTVAHTVGSTDQGWIGAPQREMAQTTGAPGYGDPGSASIHYYDTKGRPSINLTQADAKYFYTYLEYDAYSRPASVRYFWRPTGDESANTPYYWNDWGYTYTYDSESYLLTLADSAGRIWWQADTTTGYDYLDRPVKVRKGAGHWTTRTYRSTDGLLTAIKTGPSVGSSAIQNLTFAYDGLGNLTGRTVAGTGGPGSSSASESFAYDTLNRLTSNGIAYAPNGNITAKQGVDGSSAVAGGGDPGAPVTLSNYKYESGRPHAVTGVTATSTTTSVFSFSYDANKN